MRIPSRRCAAALLRPLSAALLSVPLVGCVSFNWTREIVQQPPDPGAREALRAGGDDPSTLAECLELLGAPTLVREHRVHGVVMAWSWGRDRFVGVQVTVPVGQSESVSFSYTDGRLRGYGLVLWFDPELRLVEHREGRLTDLLGLEKPPPATLDDIEDA